MKTTTRSSWSSDVQGKPRIRIGVDATGEPASTMLNPDGKEVDRAGK
jgi:hypothetical protein